MVGFTESLNISVSAAIVLYALSSRLRQEIPDWQLSGRETDEVMHSWLCSSVKHAEKIVDHYLSRFNDGSSIVP
jgi:tRNA (guanosine-2'-O-)-methyltransferase